MHAEGGKAHAPEDRPSLDCLTRISPIYDISPISPYISLYHPYISLCLTRISPISRLYLPYISLCLTRISVKQPKKKKSDVAYHRVPANEASDFSP